MMFPTRSVSRPARALGLAAALLCAGMATPSAAALVASENFEAGATGWSNNFTENPGPNAGGFTTFLGRHGQEPPVSKTFTLSGAQTQVSIAFDLYRIDSWDGEFFTVTASDGVGPNASLSHQGVFSDGPANDVYQFWTDRIAPLSLVFNTTATSFTLTFSSTLDQHFTDEAWGVDNLVITDNTQVVTPPGVPEPATWAVMILGFGAAGSMLRRRRLQTA